MEIGPTQVVLLATMICSKFWKKMAHGCSPARYPHLWYTGMKSIKIPSQSVNQNELLAANTVLFWQGHTKLRSATPVEAVLLVVTLSTSWSKFSKVLHFIRLRPLEEIRGSMKGNKNQKSHKCVPKCQCNAWNLCIAVIHRKHSWPSARVSSPVWLSFRPIVTFGSLSFLPFQVIARSWRCFPGRRSNDRPWPPVGAEAVRCNEGPAARWSALGAKCAGRICRARNKTFGTCPHFWRCHDFFCHYHHSRHAYVITIAIDSYDHFLVPFSRSEFLRLIGKYTGHPRRATATRRWRARAPWHIHAICFFSSFLFYLLLETVLRWCKYAHLLSWLLFHSGDMLNFLWCANCGKTLELPIIHRWNSVVELLPFSLFWSAIFLQVFCMYLLAHNMKRKVKMHLQKFPSFSEARFGPYVARTNGSKR